MLRDRLVLKTDDLVITERTEKTIMVGRLFLHQKVVSMTLPVLLDHLIGEPETVGFSHISASTTVRLQALREKIRRKKRTKKTHQSVTERRSEHAKERLRKIQSRIKRLKSAEKVLKRKVSYYQRRERVGRATVRSV